MRIKSNSLLAVLMAVMLILGLTPSTAFAADQKATPGTVTLIQQDQYPVESYFQCHPLQNLL